MTDELNSVLTDDTGIYFLNSMSKTKAFEDLIKIVDAMAADLSKLTGINKEWVIHDYSYEFAPSIDQKTMDDVLGKSTTLTRSVIDEMIRGK